MELCGGDFLQQTVQVFRRGKEIIGSKDDAIDDVYEYLWNLIP